MYEVTKQFCMICGKPHPCKEHSFSGLLKDNAFVKKLKAKPATLKDYLASEVTQTRLLIAIKAALDSIKMHRRFGAAVSNEKAATILTAIVIETLAPQLPPDGPDDGEKVDDEDKAS